MYPLTLFLRFAAVGAVALSLASIPARADEFVQNLGPVKPNEPILTTVGRKRIIAFYELNHRQVVHIDSIDNKSINLQCGDLGDAWPRRHQQVLRASCRRETP